MYEGRVKGESTKITPEKGIGTVNKYWREKRLKPLKGSAGASEPWDASSMGIPVKKVSKRGSRISEI